MRNAEAPPEGSLFRDTGGCGVPCWDALRARGVWPLRKTKNENGVWAGAQRRPFANRGAMKCTRRASA
jgi:hypothetical protein